ncbi:MAG TPA: MerR family transcriptional regulator [Paracoccaceae bacterium]|nr:MerR family transcriptional regulator [Paracoccaceae bacterium]
MEKSPDAFRTISEVADHLETPAHVLRFWESRFPQIRPVKRAGGRRYYRPSDVALLAGIRRLLHEEGLTIRGVQKILREQGVRHVAGLSEGAILVMAEEDGRPPVEVPDAPGEVPEAPAEVPDAPEEVPEAPEEWPEAPEEVPVVPEEFAAADPAPVAPAVRPPLPDLPLFAPLTAALAQAVDTAPPPAGEAEEVPLATRLRALPRVRLRDRADRLAPLVARLERLRDRVADRGRVPRR